ncbi:MAG TPA: PadR family transcriptional regulator [Candidatus Acidoferrum sp.]|nr:PadR family transcriptional regulator [Candidatus Acidoferrum sp.]
MDANLRASKQTLKLFAALTAKASSWHYGYALSRETGLQSGTLYPILMRLEERGWLETQWEAPQELPEKRGGRPPRHMYRLTSGGQAWAVEALSAMQSKAAVGTKSTLGGKTKPRGTLRPARQHTRIHMGEPVLEQG